jgi:hypothetical protein
MRLRYEEDGWLRLNHPFWVRASLINLCTIYLSGTQKTYAWKSKGRITDNLKEITSSVELDAIEHLRRYPQLLLM